MYLIALCDDEVEELKKEEQILHDYCRQHGEIEFQIDRFQSSKKLLETVKEEDYSPDILFMDVYLQGKLGTETARELRKMGQDCRIVFLTTSKEHALEAFQVDAVQYLVKPVSDKELFPVLDKVLADMDREQKHHLLLRVDSTIRRIALRDIVYFEAQKKNQCIFLKNGQRMLIRMTMAKLHEMLSGYEEFTKVGISYIVNLEHIEGLNSQEMIMDNGEKIYLPRGSYKELREKYFNFYFE